MITGGRARTRTGGELEIIRYLRKRFPVKHGDVLAGIGDDAMVLRDGYVISTDSFFDKTHFDLSYFSYAALGQHVMAASLSDIAAMAAIPVAALVALCVTKKTGAGAIRELYDGFARLTRKYNCDIAGGDIVKCQTFGMTITVIGRTGTPLLRSGARPGDSLFVTNFLGLAETGRIVLREKWRRSEYPGGVEKHLFPQPRIDEARALRKYATACIDTSDGLATDAFHLAEESRVRIVLDLDHLPIHPEVGRLCGLMRVDPTRFILSAGEDFELLFTASGLPKVKGIAVFRIGWVTKGQGLYMKTGGRERRIWPAGYQHLE